MKSITHFELAWELYLAGINPGIIADRLNCHRATVFRWIKEIKRLGINEFVVRKKTVKRRRQPRKLKNELVGLVCTIRSNYDWCGEKIKKELLTNHGIRIGLRSIYRILHKNFKVGSKWNKYRDRKDISKAYAPRDVIQHDTVDFGELYAFTSIDVFTKEPMVVIDDNLTSLAGVNALNIQMSYYGHARINQSDEGSEFKGEFPDTVKKYNSIHVYSRPYKKNDQCYIENFNRSLRKECLGWGKYKKEDKVWVQKKVNEWVAHFISRRWHMGLPDMQTPQSFINEWYNNNSI